LTFFVASKYLEFAAILSIVCIADAQNLTIEQLYTIPEWAMPAFERSDFAKRYELDGHINPFCLYADFDGDGKLDFTTLIVDGHLRLKAAQKLKIETVPVILCDEWTPAQVKRPFRASRRPRHSRQS
jgi:hypothetical protein